MFVCVVILSERLSKPLICPVRFQPVFDWYFIHISHTDDADDNNGDGLLGDTPLGRSQHYVNSVRSNFNQPV